MKKLIIGAFLFALSATFSFAQTLVTDDFKKFEVFGGYSNNQVDTGANNTSGNSVQNFFNDRESFNGFNASGVGNINRYVGIKGDVSGHYKNFRVNIPAIGTVPATTAEIDASLYNFLGGVQVKDNATEGSRLRPFGHALIGVAHARSKVDNSFFSSAFCQQPGVDCRQQISESDTGFAAAIGGGLDVKATERFSIRAIQVDYNPNRFNGSFDHNFRIGVGVVFH